MSIQKDRSLSEVPAHRLPIPMRS